MDDKAELEEEISLLEIIRVFVRQKWLIFGGTLLVTAIALGMAYISPHTYKVSFVVELGSTGAGLVESPENLDSKIKMGHSFTTMLALKLPEEQFPEIMVSNPKDTKLAEISLVTAKPSMGVEILNYVQGLLLKDHGKVFNQIKVDIEGRIKSVGLKLAAIDNKDKMLEKRLELIQKNKDVMTKQMIEIKARIDDLYKEKRAMMKNTSSAKSLNIFEISNQMIENQKYYNSLQEKVDVTLAQDDVAMRDNILSNVIARQTLELEKLKLESERNALQETRIIKEPAFSNIPVGPKKRLMVISAFLVSLIGFSILALFIEFIKNLSRQA